MKTYNYLYVREQRHRLSIPADTEEQAHITAQSLIRSLDLSSPDDESDDPGELSLEDAE